MAFHVGQKVVCVDDKPPLPYKGWEIKVGSIYEIERVGLRGWLDNRPCVKLLGIRDHYPSDQQFWEHRFRPLIERKTDISSLLALLNPKNHKVLEGA